MGYVTQVTIKANEQFQLSNLPFDKNAKTFNENCDPKHITAGVSLGH